MGTGVLVWMKRMFERCRVGRSRVEQVSQVRKHGKSMGSFRRDVYSARDGRWRRVEFEALFLCVPSRWEQVVAIQRWWRCVLLRVRLRRGGLVWVKAATVVQRWWGEMKRLGRQSRVLYDAFIEVHLTERHVWDMDTMLARRYVEGAKAVLHDFVVRLMHLCVCLTVSRDDGVCVPSGSWGHLIGQAYLVEYFANSVFSVCLVGKENDAWEEWMRQSDSEACVRRCAHGLIAELKKLVRVGGEFRDWVDAMQGMPTSTCECFLLYMFGFERAYGLWQERNAVKRVKGFLEMCIMWNESLECESSLR